MDLLTSLDVLTAATLAAEATARERAATQAQHSEAFEWLATAIVRAQAVGEAVNLRVPRRISLLVDQLNDVKRECHAAGLKDAYSSNLVDAAAMQFQEHVRSLWPSLPAAANSVSLSPSSPLKGLSTPSSTPSTLAVLNCPRAIRCCRSTAAGIQRDLDAWYSSKLVSNTLTDLRTKELSDDTHALTLAVFEHWYRMQWIRTQFAKLAHAAQEIMKLSEYAGMLSRPIAERDDILRRVKRAVSYGEPASPGQPVAAFPSNEWDPVTVHLKLRGELLPKLRSLQQHALTLIRSCLRDHPDDVSAIHAAAKPFFDAFRTVQLVLLSPSHSGIVVVPKST